MGNELKQFVSSIKNNMKNFSSIEDNLITSKDSLVESFVLESGLPKEFVVKLYEDYSLHGINVEDKFKSMLNVGLTTFTESMGALMDILKDTSKDALNGLILQLLNVTAENNSASFFKIIMYLLFMKDQANFVRISKDMNIDEKIAGFLDNKTTNLFESIGVNPELNGKVPTIIGLNDGCDIREDIQFYGDLKHLLARNNKRWGNNYHLDNTFQAICAYLDYEIEYLTNKDSITSVDNSFEDTLIRQLMNDQLNVMYRDVQTLRPLISDLQTLNFDLMCLIMSFVRTNSEYCQYISRATYVEFFEAFRAMYSKLSTSRTKSLVLVPYDNCDCKPQDGNGSLEILENVYVDTCKYDLYQQPLTVQAVVDMLYIIKSCSFDFNINIRPFFRNFVTKGFEVIGKMEHIMLEAKKINKYKSRY